MVAFRRWITQYQLERIYNYIRVESIKNEIKVPIQIEVDRKQVLLKESPVGEYVCPLMVKPKDKEDTDIKGISAWNLKTTHTLYLCANSIKLIADRNGIRYRRAVQNIMQLIAEDLATGDIPTTLPALPYTKEIKEAFVKNGS